MSQTALPAVRTKRPPQPVLAALRAGTQAAHERLHHAAPFAALAEGRLDRAEYRALLGRLLGFHAPMEAAIATALHGTPSELGHWQRTDLLLQDLATLGADPAAIAALPRIGPPAGLGPAAAMGCLYVTEGSTLGGRVLARQLDPILPDQAGRRFLSAGGQPGRLRWPEFCAAIERCGAQPGQADAVIQGAQDCFGLFEAWFAPGFDDVQ